MRKMMNDFHHRLEREIPRLRRYARALTRNAVRADDLVQETLVHALYKGHLLQPGTDLLEEQRQVILIVGLEGVSYEEAAAILDVTIGTIRSRLSRGRESLRKLM